MNTNLHICLFISFLLLFMGCHRSSVSDRPSFEPPEWADSASGLYSDHSASVVMEGHSSDPGCDAMSEEARALALRQFGQSLKQQVQKIRKKFEEQTASSDSPYGSVDNWGPSPVEVQMNQIDQELSTLLSLKDQTAGSVNTENGEEYLCYWLYEAAPRELYHTILNSFKIDEEYYIKLEASGVLSELRNTYGITEESD